ncbi:RE1, partial [Symbiodinium microadriaticum]
DALVQRESARQLAPGDPPAMEPERPVQQSSMPGAMGAAPSVPQRGSTSAGDPWTAIWEGLYGKFGARAKAGAARHPSPPPPPQVSETTVPQTAPAIGYPSHGLSSAASPGILEALTQGMQQLQDLQAKALKKDHAGDDVPEVVKTATVSLPELPAPTGEMSGLHAVAGLVGANNYLYAGFVSWVWRLVGISAGDGFRDLCGLVGSNTTGTITDQSGGSPEAFFWKVDSSECESLCLDDAVVFGVHQGAAERGVVLKHLQGMDVPGDISACLERLRSWPRWLQRCRDMGMTIPDGSLLARSLSSTTAKYLAENQDALFRTQLMRSTYRIDAQPGIDDVVRYQQHLQAEIENIMISKASAGVTGPSVKAVTPVAGAELRKIYADLTDISEHCVATEPGITPGQPVLSWEALLQAAAKVAGSSPPTEPKAPTMKVMSIIGSSSADGVQDGAYALVDSGATHPLRRARSVEEWRSASPVIVHLAGGEIVELKMNEAGTLLVPHTGSTRSASSSPIVPLGSLVGVLGYKMEWHGSRCRLISRDGESLTLRVRDGCPEITEQQALELISRIEDQKLAELRNATSTTRTRIRESVIALNKSWFDHLIAYCNSGIGTDSLMAIHSAPFLSDVPEEALYGLSEADPVSNGWDALRGLKHLNRKTRKRLWSSRRWVVHLYAGKKANEEVMFLERQGFVVLELDIERGTFMDYEVVFNWMPSLDADARGAFPKPHKYLFVAKLKVPRTFVDDGKGLGEDYDLGEASEDTAPIDENAFDYVEPRSGVEAEDSALGEEKDGDEPCDGEEEEHLPEKRLSPEDDLDMVAPETVNLIFATALPDNKSSTVLEAIQDVVTYCWSLNVPIVRFHCDRGMEFYAKATRQWIKYHGMRFTTSEGGLHQQNGLVENAVRYIKQRARTLLLGAKLPQRLWPQAVTMAASVQRASVLGMETRLAAPFGAKVLVRRREYGGTAEPGKPDDLAPRWLKGRYVGLSDTLRRGHLVYLSADDGEKFVHTVNVRVGAEEAPLPEPELEADLPGPPSRRLRGKASGSGDVVTVSKAQTLVGTEELKLRAEGLLEDWSQEEAEKLIVHIALSLDHGDRKFGVFRHGGQVGLTRATYEYPWIARFFARAVKEKSPEAEFSALYMSVNTSREVHADSNNLTGLPNYLYPIAVPRRGGDLWIELSDGDVVKGKIVEMVDAKGTVRYGCVQPLVEGQVVSFDPHRRHAVLPWKGLRIVLVAYTPGVPQNLKGPEREVLSQLGFPIPSEVELTGPVVALRSMSVLHYKRENTVQEEEGNAFGDTEVICSDGSPLYERGVCDGSDGLCADGSSSQASSEEWDLWDMYLPLSEGDPCDVPKALIASCDGSPQLHKAEVTFTKGIEDLLDSLRSPLTVVHNVDPTEAAGVFSRWVPSVQKELSSFDSAARKINNDDPQVLEDLRTGKAKIVPMKVVYTVKPPSEEAASAGELFRRKARIVACGNMMAESGEETYAGTAPAEVVRSALSISSLKGWDAATLDVTAAFLQTPLKEVQCQQRILGQPPRALVRAGLCGERELWEFTHAVYGLRESPRWWGEFRDHRLAQLSIVVGSRRLKLLQCRVEGSWWKLVEDKVLVGVIVVYVDDLLICSTPSIIAAVSEAVKNLWATSSLSWASDGGVRFLGIEISKVEGGFALNQEPYIQELLRTIQALRLMLKSWSLQLQNYEQHNRAIAHWLAGVIGQYTGELEIFEATDRDEQIADALTKALSSGRLRDLARAMGILQLEEIVKLVTTSNNTGSSKASAVMGCDASELTMYEPMSVDRSLVVWWLFAIVVLVWTLAWELIKFVGWRIYFNAIPGADNRRLRRLQRLRDTTADAIQAELTMRRRAETDRRRTERDARGTSSSSRQPSSPLGGQPTVYRADQRDRAVQTSGPSFAPQVPQIRTEVRREIQIPEHVHI